MACERFRLWVSADIDGELAAKDRAELQAHMSGCEGCRAHAAALRAVKSQVAAAKTAAPASLAARVRAAVARPETPGSAWFRPVAIAASLAVAAVLALRLMPDPAAPLVADHVAGLGKPVAVSSGLKPWFVQRLAYAPPVVAGEDAGCSLEGGRIADIHDRQTAALAYMCAGHAVTVYVEPSAKGVAAPQASRHGGYQVVTWRGTDMACQAVSDMDAKDLLRLARLIQAHAHDA